MAITILEAMKLPTLKDFELIAGYRGLDREIQRASILDYEYEKSLSDKPIQTYFEKEVGTDGCRAPPPCQSAHRPSAGSSSCVR